MSSRNRKNIKGAKMFCLVQILLADMAVVFRFILTPSGLNVASHKATINDANIIC